MEHPDEPAEAAAVALKLPGADRRGHAGRRDRGAVPDQRAVAGLRGGADRRRACRTSSRAPSGSSSAPRSARRCCCSGAPRPAAASPARWCPRSATCWPRPAGRSTGRPPSGAARDRWQSLAALVDLAVDLVAENPTLDLAGFVGHLAERANAQHAPTVQGVTLASMHAAKGLEWDVVFVVGLVDGVVPIAQSLARPEAVDEERRLLYVAVTRARERLTLSWSLARNPGAKRARPRSRFLTGLAPESTASGAARPADGEAAQGRARGRGGRAVRAAARLAQLGGPDGLGARVRRLHRRDAAGDRRDPAGQPA